MPECPSRRRGCRRAFPRRRMPLASPRWSRRSRAFVRSPCRRGKASRSPPFPRRSRRGPSPSRRTRCSRPSAGSRAGRPVPPRRRSQPARVARRRGGKRSRARVLAAAAGARRAANPGEFPRPNAFLLAGRRLDSPRAHAAGARARDPAGQRARVYTPPRAAATRGGAGVHQRFRAGLLQARSPTGSPVAPAASPPRAELSIRWRDCCGTVAVTGRFSNRGNAG
jgi:hypothetical protein